MGEQPADKGDEASVHEPVVAWLDEIGAAEGLTREETVEYLVSSYWQLKEVIDLLEGSDAAGGWTSGSGPGDTPDRPPVQGIADDLDRLSQHTEEPAADPTELQRVLSAVDDVATRLSDLETAIEAVAERDQGVAAPSIEDVDDRLEAAETQLADLEAALRSLHGEFANLRDESVPKSTVAELADETEAFQDSITTRHETLRERVITEFDHIRTILTHLLETAEDDGPSEEAIADLQETLDAHLADRERLAAITRTANRMGLREADCDYCGHTVDLGLLESARCPNCEHAFSDVEATDGWFGLFRSGELVTDTSG